MNKLKLSLPLISIFIVFLLGSSNTFAGPVFNWEGIVTDVRSSGGRFIVLSRRQDGVRNQGTIVTPERSYLLGQALNAQADGGVHTLVVTPTEGGDTRCRDNNESLHLLAIQKK